MRINRVFLGIYASSFINPWKNLEEGEGEGLVPQKLIKTMCFGGISFQCNLPYW